MLLLLLACASSDPKDDTAPDADADTDSDSDTDADTDADTAPQEEVVVTNVADLDACDAGISASAGEDGFWAAGRLQPPSYPFTLRDVRYRLRANEGKDGCDSSVAHAAELFVGGESPSATPADVDHFDVEAGSSKYDRNLLLTTDGELVLEDGEYLYVSVQLTPGACLTACYDPTADTELSWWSNAEAPPYDWVTLASFGIEDVYGVSMVGTVPAAQGTGTPD